jgi:hemin uptake protein HemP
VELQMDVSDQNSIPTGTQESSPEQTPLRVIRSDEIFRGGREVRIEHEESVYRLRLTRKGKLILHK